MLRVRRTPSILGRQWVAATLATAAAVSLAAGQVSDQVWAQTPGAPSGLHSGLVLLLGIGVLALLLVLPRFGFLIARRAILAVIRPAVRVVRAVMKPIARILRVLRILPREPRPLAAPSVAALTTGTIGRAFAGVTETEEAIARGVDARELEGMIQRNGQLLCSWLAPMPAPRVAYDAKAAEADREKVRRFFSTPVPTYFNP